MQPQTRPREIADFDDVILEIESLAAARDRLTKEDADAKT